MSLKPVHALLAILVAAIWGFSFVVIKVGVSTAPPLLLTGLRFLFADLSVESASANPYRPAQGPWRFEAATPAIEAQLLEALAALPPAREGFERLFELIHASLRDDSPPPVTLDEAEAALSLVTAIYASAAADGAPIALPLPATDPARTDWRPAGGGFAKSLA